LPMRQRPVKSPFLDFGFSSSSKLKESSLEKLKSLRAAHAWDMIFYNFFFFFLSPNLGVGGKRPMCACEIYRTKRMKRPRPLTEAER
jgi:hypothetical protein